MLNIGKLAAGGESYYLGTVAAGVEDYYTGAGEAPGYWLGAATGAVGLSGRAHAEALRAVLGAADPATGAPLTDRASRRSVPGFDCTFRTPKSVSLLYGLGDPETSLEARRAHDAAVAAAVAYLERHAGFSRRGHGGAEGVATTGFVAAAFRHRTSRAGDPLLHTHVLVANLGQATDDGRWRSLDARSLYVHAKTAGYLYQAHLRAELTRRLGVEWGPVRNGCADLAGVPDEVLRAFSQRRAEIVAHMQRRGETSAKAAQAATLATRRPKDRTVEPAALGAEWLTRAAALGFGPQRVAALLGVASDHPPDASMLAAVAGELAGPGGLTARASTFTRRDVVRGWCDRLPAGADAEQVLALSDALLADGTGAAVRLVCRQSGEQALSGDQVLRRADGRLVAADADEPRYSTPELLALEQRVLTTALARQDAATAIASRPAVEAALARRPSLTGEQAAMVRRLATSGAGVEVVVGKAGAGKTFALDAARDAWQASGVRVLGCALAARAAAELRAGARIDSVTVDALLADLDRPGRHGGLAPGSVLVVDEAGMVGTRKLARLLDHADRADAKVVLVGDHHQLPEIDAGGVFRGLVHRLPVTELTENRRQCEEWERGALDELRTGDPAAAVDAYQRAGRVVVGDTAEAVREQLVCDWWAAAAEADGPGEGVMIAARVSDVDDLNDRARVRLAAAGHLTGPALTTTNDRELRAGDRVVCLHNDRRLGVVNGTRARVTTIDHSAGSVTVQTDREDRVVVLSSDYLDAGHVAHGYAITAHKAQGLTTDRAWVLGCDAVYREWGYVALSRGRDANHLYLVAGADPDREEELHAKQPAAAAEPLRSLVQALRRSRGQHLAVDVGDPPPGGARIHGPATRGSRGSDVDPTAPPQHSRRGARLDRDRAFALSEVDTTSDRLRAAQDRAGQLRGFRGLFRRDQARAAQLEINRLSVQLQAWQQRLAELDEPPDRGVGRQGTAAQRHAASADLPHAAEFAPPSYLTALLGPRPDEPVARSAWRTGVRAAESYRSAWGVTDTSHPLGEPPADQAQRRAYQAALAAIRAAQLGEDRPAPSRSHSPRAGISVG